MDVEKIALGDNYAEGVNVVIEVPARSSVKYELDKESGAIMVDRFLQTPMYYPADYGFLPHTLADDGDPLDALVITRTPLLPGTVIKAKPVGILYMEDEKGKDEKVKEGVLESARIGPTVFGGGAGAWLGTLDEEYEEKGRSLTIYEAKARHGNMAAIKTKLTAT